MLEFVLMYLYGEQEGQLGFRNGSVEQGETLLLIRGYWTLYVFWLLVMIC